MYKLESKIRSRSRKYNTRTADDWRAGIARVQYSMRHACSTMMLRHANVRKTCSLNSDHHFLSIPLLSNPVAAACAMHPVRAAWLQLTLRHSPSSSVLPSKRADVLVELAGRRRRKRELKAHGEGTTGLRGIIAMAALASVLLPLVQTDRQFYSGRSPLRSSPAVPAALSHAGTTRLLNARVATYRCASPQCRTGTPDSSHPIRTAPVCRAVL